MGGSMLNLAGDSKVNCCISEKYMNQILGYSNFGPKEKT